MKPDAIVADFPLRRRMLRWGLAAPLALAGCAPRLPALGCREVVLQWTGVSGGTAPAWRVPDAVMETIFDTASARGLNVRVGLPFDHGWWERPSRLPIRPRWRRVSSAAGRRARPRAGPNAVSRTSRVRFGRRVQETGMLDS